MALTVTVGGVGITAYVPFLGDERFGLPGLRIDQDAATYAWRATIPIIDSASAVSVAEEDTVAIADGATTFFSGRVAYIDRRPIGTDTVVYVLDCQSKHVLLEETLVESESYSQGTSDSSIIDDLFTTYLSSIDSTTYVSTLDASMEAITFTGKTLRQCLTMIAARTGGRFYIDVDDNLHYFSSESNAAAFDLSDNPDFSTTYPCEGLRERTDATVLIDKVLVVGSGVSGWVGSGDHEAIVWDETITTSQGVTDRGNAIIGRYQNGLVTYTCSIREDGLQAGMDIDVTNSLLGLSAETLTIRRLHMTCESADGAERLYELELGEALITSAAAGRNLADYLADTAGATNNVSDDVFDTDAPSAPTFVLGNLTTGVTIDEDGHQSAWIKATWGSVADTDLDHYEIQCADNNSFNYPMVFRTQAGDTREVIFTGLIANVDHYLRVRAVDWVGNYSAWSPASPGYLTQTTDKDTSAPAQVSGEAAAGARTLIGVTWTANSEADLSHYQVQRSATGAWGGEETTVDYPRLTHFIDEDFTEAQIAASTTFYYRVRAVDTSGNEGTWSGTANASLNPIGSDTIAAGAIIAAHVGANEIIANTANIQAGLIVNGHIAAGTIEADRMNVSQLSAIAADLGTITAGEIRVGTGTPGVDFTGFRIFSSYIAGYTADVAQFYVDSSDGKAYWAGGDGELTADGMTLNVPSTATYDSKKAITWTDETGNFQIWGYRTSAPETGGIIEVDAPSGDTASIQFRLWINDVGQGSMTLDSSTGFEVSTSPILLSGNYTKISDVLFVNEIANAFMTQGITINQGTNADEAFAIQGSNIGHGMTTDTETNTFFHITRESSTGGGASLYGYTDTDAAAYAALNLYGRLGEAASTTKSAAGWGIINLVGQVKSGTTVAAPGADANLVSIASSGNVRFIFDQEGEMHCDAVIGAGDDWDEWDDLALAADLSRLPRARWNEMMRYQAEDFERAGLLTLSVDEEGERHAFLRIRAMAEFSMCCFREVGERFLDVGERLQAVEHRLALLEA